MPRSHRELVERLQRQRRANAPRCLGMCLLVGTLLFSGGLALISVFFSPPGIARADGAPSVTEACHQPTDDPKGHVRVVEVKTTIMSPQTTVTLGTMDLLLEFCTHFQSFFTRLSFQSGGYATAWPLTSCLVEKQARPAEDATLYSAFCATSGDQINDGATRDSAVRGEWYTAIQRNAWHACWSDPFGAGDPSQGMTSFTVCTPWMQHTADLAPDDPQFEPLSGASGQCGQAGQVPTLDSTGIPLCQETYTGDLNALPHAASPPLS